MVRKERAKTEGRTTNMEGHSFSMISVFQSCDFQNINRTLKSYILTSNLFIQVFPEKLENKLIHITKKRTHRHRNKLMVTSGEGETGTIQG